VHEAPVDVDARQVLPVLVFLVPFRELLIARNGRLSILQVGGNIRDPVQRIDQVLLLESLPARSPRQLVILERRFLFAVETVRLTRIVAGDERLRGPPESRTAA